MSFRVEISKKVTLRKHFINRDNIVILSSLNAKTAYVNIFDYTMSKSVLNTASEMFSKELLKCKVCVKTIMLGRVSTSMTEGLKEETVFSTVQLWKLIELERKPYLIEFFLLNHSWCVTRASIPVSAGMNFC